MASYAPLVPTMVTDQSPGRACPGRRVIWQFDTTGEERGCKASPDAFGWAGVGQEPPAPPYKRRQWARSRFSRCTGSATISSCSTVAATAIALDAAAARALADRRTGIGCDQLILLEPPRHPDGPGSDAHPQCRRQRGRGLRQCHALRRRPARSRDRRPAGADRDRGRVCSKPKRWPTGALRSIWDRRAPAGAKSRWRARMDTSASIWRSARCPQPVCTNIGNPHATFFVDDAEAIDLAALGPVLEHHPLFPERANIGVAAIRDREQHPAARVGARRRHHPRPAAAAPAPRSSRRIGAGWPGAARPSSSMAARSTSRGARTGT